MLLSSFNFSHAFQEHDPCCHIMSYHPAAVALLRVHVEYHIEKRQGCVFMCVYGEGCMCLFGVTLCCEDAQKYMCMYGLMGDSGM